MQKWSWGWYNIKNLAQDQVVIKIGQGSRIDTYRGLHLGTNEDSQSDYTDVTPARFMDKEIILSQVIQQLTKDALDFWKLEYSSDVEEPIECVKVIDLIDERETDTTADDISQWTSGQLASAIMDIKAESDMPRLREMIFIAEDIDFTVAQSEQLAPRLLSFAEKYRDSNDPQDEPAVWSAIRTGASMLRPNAAERLLPLLEPGHSIDTSLVTVKMVGRIFEAQPTAKVDEYKELANEICQIARFLLNPHAITASPSAAKAQLAIYALAAMASSKIHGVIKDVQRLNMTWFTKQTLRELRELANIWANRPVPVADRPQKLLDRVIQTLE
jgi:hypothetical protein